MAGTRQEFSGSEDWSSCGGQNGCEPYHHFGDVQQHPAGLIHDVSAEQSGESLARMIEAEIIPRLMLAHRCEGLLAMSANPDLKTPMSEDVAEFARIAVEHDAAVACGYVHALRSQGFSLETIFIDLISPAARLLGDMWTADVTDFTEVTIGLTRLQQVVHYFGPAFQNEKGAVCTAGRALLTTMPGDQHTLGISMVEEFFRRAGWEVTCCAFSSQQELTKVVRNEKFDLIGLSAGSDLLLGRLTSVIRALRKASCNRAVRIVVGGRLFVEHPEYAALSGADGTAMDARQAILQFTSPPAAGVAAER
jgi:MerR family transcriptional regulator, light-induced transcriptional regulator